jgi:polar amino acid transport system ATP-binding protein
MVAVNGIVLENVAKSYGGRRVLDGISMTIDQGETVALVGPSGGGKSTLLRCINGLCPFDSGEIRVGKHRLTQNSGNPAATAAVRRLYGMIFQDFQLFPHMTALQNVMEAPRQVLRKPLDECRQLATRLLERVGLADRLHDYPRQLSGGQRQRVAIARALAMSPSGLLCDEITSALDPELKSEVLAALGELKRDGLTLILVTHEIHFARRAADRVFFLADGQIVEQGPANDVLQTPQTPRARQFLRQVLE